MLEGNFFDIKSFTTDESEANLQQSLATVSLNINHPIYNGHFPGNPVVPGVCQVQMVKELAEHACSQALNLRESDNIKFLSMINPMQNSILEFSILIKPIGEKQISVTASIGSGSLVFFKFKGKFEAAA